MTTRGRRRELRSECADLLKIRWKDGGGVSHGEIAMLEDISTGGLCLKMETPVAPGTSVAVLYPGGHYRGRVKHCETQMGWYFIGVEFEPGYRWTKDQYQPEHLLQFRFRSPRARARSRSAS